jgi:hypothetical protein
MSVDLEPVTISLEQGRQYALVGVCDKDCRDLDLRLRGGGLEMADIDAPLAVVSGTSFATPRSAGTFSRVLLSARRATSHRGGIVTRRGRKLMVAGRKPLTNWEMRRALEEGAYYLGTGEFTPGPGSSTWNLTSLPVVDAAPWVQTGWGAITPDPERGVVKETLAHLGIGGEATRFKEPEACDFMTANIEARRLYWDNLAVFGESHGTTEDPYIYC